MKIEVLAPVVLAVDVPDRGLTRGELGTVVEALGKPEDAMFLVEFADENGVTYEMAPLPASVLIPIHGRNNAAA